MTAAPRRLVDEYAVRLEAVRVRPGAPGIPKQVFLGAHDSEVNVHCVRAVIEWARQQDRPRARAARPR